MRRRKGFTLIELVLVIGFLTIMAAASFPLYEKYFQKHSVVAAVQAIVNNVHRAQALSMAWQGDSSWGTYAAQGRIILFKGASFASRDVNYDEITAVDSNIIFFGNNEATFNKLTGELPAAVAIIVSFNENEPRNITINQKGMVEY